MDEFFNTYGKLVQTGEEVLHTKAKIKERWNDEGEVERYVEVHIGSADGPDMFLFPGRKGAEVQVELMFPEGQPRGEPER